MKSGEYLLYGFLSKMAKVDPKDPTRCLGVKMDDNFPQFLAGNTPVSLNTIQGDQYDWTVPGLTVPVKIQSEGDRVTKCPHLSSDLDSGRPVCTLGGSLPINLTGGVQINWYPNCAKEEFLENRVFSSE